MTLIYQLDNCITNVKKKQILCTLIYWSEKALYKVIKIMLRFERIFIVRLL